VRFAVTSVGYVVLFIGALAMAGVSWQRLLIGAGLVSVVIGIAELTSFHRFLLPVPTLRRNQ